MVAITMMAMTMSSLNVKGSMTKTLDILYAYWNNGMLNGSKEMRQTRLQGWDLALGLGREEAQKAQKRAGPNSVLALFVLLRGQDPRPLLDTLILLIPSILS